ncbi:hypothetical protein [Pseudomonas sp. A-B-19]|uniref:hypothetical protein n=1 Tax=Pseudomonas sp. A-B-19 TaxID=2832405 RepID=UPI001CC01893|nr:hypothetical protein [Pseudomonas sp. A-B-19]
MQAEGFSEWLGQVLGSIIRFIVDALSGLFNLLSNASSNFVEGLSQALGMDTSVISIMTLILGLILLWSAIRAFLNASFIMGIIWLMLGLWLLSWIIH